MSKNGNRKPRHLVRLKKRKANDVLNEILIAFQHGDSPQQSALREETRSTLRNQTDTYLPNAPDVLKAVHRSDLSSPYRSLLYSLLKNPHMEPAWGELAVRFEQVTAAFAQEKKQDRGKRQLGWLYQRDSLYERLWREIKYARGICKTNIEPRSKIRHRFERITLDAIKLAEAVSPGPLVLSMGLQRLREKSKKERGYAPGSAKSLGLPSYEFYPTQVAVLAFQNHNWARLNSEERDNLAFRILKDTSWPYISELFVEFAERAFREAQEIASVRRTVDRNTQHTSINVFVQILHERFFKRFMKGPMAATLARIASVALGKEVTKDLVLEALSSRNTKSPSIPPAAPHLI